MARIQRYPRVDTISQADTGNVSYGGVEQRAPRVGGQDVFENVDRAAQVGAQAMHAEAIRLQDRENVDMVFRAESAAKDELSKFLLGEQEKQGIDAWGASERASRWFEEAARKHGENLTNDAQRRVFEQSMAKLRLASSETIAKHEVQQRNKSLAESAEATIMGSINFAAANHENGAAIDTAKGDIVKRIASVAQLRGWTAEQKEFATADKVSTLHLQVLENMVRTNPDGAKAYYELNKGEIQGTKRDGIERVLGEGTLRKRVQTIVDEVSASGLSEAEGITRIRQQFSGEEEDRAVTALKIRFKELSDARERSQRDAADAAYNIFARTGRLDSIPPALLEKLDGKVLIALRKDAKHLAEGTQPRTDPAIYYMLRQLAARQPDQFANIDLRQYFPNLGRGDREGLIDLQANALKPEKQRDMRTLQQQLTHAYNLMGLKAADAEKKGLFEHRVVEMLQDAEAKAGKPLKDEERQKIIDRLIIQGEVLTGSWWRNDPNKRFYEVAGTPDAARFAPFVPKSDRDQIIAAYTKQYNRKPTDKEIADLYKRRHGL